MDKFPFIFNDSFGKVYCEQHNGKYQLLQFAGLVSGYLPIMISKKYFLKSLKILFPPLGQSGETLTKEYEEVIMNNFLIYAKNELNIDRITQGETWGIFTSFPNGANYCSFGSYVLNLENSTVEDVLKEIHPKNRNVIKNAINKGVQVVCGEQYIPEFYNLYFDTMTRNNLNVEPLSYFIKLNETEVECYCALSYYNDTPVGALFIPITKNGAFYLYGASSNANPVNGAVNYLHLHTIEYLISMHVRVYDFVGARVSPDSGSKHEGIQRFKERFGANLKIGYLWKIDLKKNKCQVFDFLLKLKFKLKGINYAGDIIDQEQRRLNEKN